MKKILTYGILIAFSIFAAACTDQKTDGQNNTEGTFSHIHGLGYTGDGKRLFVPVHDGIKIYSDGKWTDAPGDKHDYMGFSMVNNGFYSSGHPAPGTTYKNPLGLVKSTDDGNSITVLALEGETDFHGMSVSYLTHTIYVFNPEPNSMMRQAGMFYSENEGKSWKKSRMSGVRGQIVALAAHPSQASVVALGAETGAYLSDDFGQTFKPVYPDKPVSAITFTHAGDLLVATVGSNSDFVKVNMKTMQVSELKTPVDTGDVITYISENPVNAMELAIATDKNDIYISPDAGTSWRQIAKQGKLINEP